MGPTKFPAPKIEVICVNATGSNAEKHLTVGKKYRVDAICPPGTLTAKGPSTQQAYVLRGVDHTWDVSRFKKA
jgi:hypothetical protein